MIAKTYSLIFFLADAIAPVKAGKYMPESLVSLSKDASSTKSIGSSERKEFSSLNDRRKGRGNRSLQGTLPSGVTDCDASIGRTGSSVAYRSASTSLYEPFEPIFCMNDGFCKSSYKLNPDNPCECVEGYAGPHCEFVGTEADVPSNCTLECQNDSTCKIGAQSWTSMLHYQFADVRPENIQYCSCSAGFFGPFCEYNVNDDNSVICGGKPCFNGGTCVETVDEVGIKSSHCDCTTADIGGVLHAGTYCENEATTQCSDDGNGRQFCVNGGTCKGDSHLGCDCPPGFVGPICEFKDLQIQPAECKLQCLNHGICRTGAKDVSFLGKFNFTNRRTLANSLFNADFEHCVCPVGFVGLQCEHQLDICPGGDYACLNGGECLTTMKGGEVRYECDCTKAMSNTNRYAGDFCEIESTQFCTVDGQMPLGGPSSNAFCTNGGICKGFAHVAEPHPGCDCPSGFFGENCQYKSTEREVEGRDTAIIWTGLSVALCLLFVVALLYFRRTTQRNTRFASINGEKAPSAADQPSHENEGNQMKTFGSDDYDHADCHSIASSKGSTSTTSSKRRSNHLKKIKKKKFSTMDRTPVDLMDDTNAGNNNNDSKDGLFKTKAGTWPNATRNPTDTASIFNEIDLGDDYGVNLVV